METFTINIPPLLAPICTNLPYMDPMGLGFSIWVNRISWIGMEWAWTNLRAAGKGNSRILPEPNF